MSENKGAAPSDAAGEELERPAAPVPEVVPGRPVRPELVTEVVATHSGQFGAADAGDTTGYGRQRTVVALAPAAARPYGSWFDGVVDALI